MKKNEITGNKMQHFVGYRGSRNEDGNVQVKALFQAEGFDLVEPVEFRKEIATHSPDGFNWGYAGSGPAELAKQLLLHYFGALETITPEEVRSGSHQALRIYQSFKFEFLAAVQEDQFTITENEITEWMKQPEIKEKIREYFITTINTGDW